MWENLLSQYPGPGWLGVWEWDLGKFVPLHPSCFEADDLFVAHEVPSPHCAEVQSEVQGGKSFAQQDHRAGLLYCLIPVIFIWGLHFLNTQPLGGG